VEVKELMEQLRSLVEGSRSKPMSGSVVVNRAQLLDVIGRLEAALAGADASGPAPRSSADPGAEADDEGQPSADARREHERLVSESEVFRVAKVAAARELSRARQEAAELRQQADDYVDTRLATFEITLTRTIEAVSRGRARLHGRSHFAELAPDGDGSGDGDVPGDAAADGEMSGGASSGGKGPGEAAGTVVEPRTAEGFARF
jgi:hypothetical protein